MEDRTGDKEQVGQSLKEMLAKFAAANKEEREKTLLHLTEFIMENVDRSIIEGLIDEKAQPLLADAVTKTDDLTFLKYDGTEIKPWAGEHTLVMLREDGQIAGAVAVEGKVWNTYGDLYKYGLIKAVCQLHLNKATITGDLADNFEYFVGLGLKPGENFFSGSSAETVLVDGRTYFVTGSGCTPKEDYMTELLAGTKPAIDTQAGRSESVFCDLTVERLKNPSAPKVIDEPRRFRDLRVNN